MDQREEVMAHLRLIPYLKVPVTLDTSRAMREAASLAGRYLVHRLGSQRSRGVGRWKSLPLRAPFGHVNRTQSHRKYTDVPSEVGPGQFAMTEVAELCPETMQLLSRITDIDSCRRIRFMLLEAGAEIIAHKDSEDDLNVVIHVALNAPPGCEFLVDILPDGRLGQFGRRIPFTPGSVFVVNVGAYHAVRNLSDEPRYHLLIEGPLAFPVEMLVEAARSQSGESTPKGLVESLLRTFVLSRGGEV